MTVLVLCHGNICRSPMAAAIMKKRGVENVNSAGFKPDGSAKTPKKVREWLLENHHIDLTGHTAVQVTPEMLIGAELILFMDGGQKKRLEQMWEEFNLETKRGPIDNFCEPLARYLKPPKEKIGDPMFQKGDSPKFIEIMNQLVEAATNFVDLRAQTPIVAEGSN